MSISEKPNFPWFGMDIGGTLVKLVYFEPIDLTEEEKLKQGDTLRTIQRYLVRNEAYGETGVRDVDLEIKAVKLGDRLGNLHFIRFPTSSMYKFIDLCVKKNLHLLTFKIYATGGGAFKFEAIITKSLNVKWIKCDELEMLVQGIEFMASLNLDEECFFFKIWTTDSNFSNPFSMSQITNFPLLKANFDLQSKKFSDTYPFILVNIGSGVSILLVNSEKDFRRVSGTSIGGGTFLGLCCLLTGCKTYEEAIDLANKGDNTKVDKLVQDIYGGDYPKFSLTSDVVASSFGLMHIKDKREAATKEDLAKATLLAVLNNVGLLAKESAVSHNCEKVVFVGNFLKANTLSKKLLSHALNYWSNGKIKALFLRHEGYFGAIGSLINFALSR
ncbi:pantothenate kinase 3 isoform X2 [Brachionus plicatilis]|uniref:pantothenate kinase n=1 Tax=Brachionus plicatilis TaxID=10195 RepID=A0A3M7RHB2_BRAPC|nr:pantothenate kinase 3 isoform X2 [Brachionus plicatilis]